MKKIFRIIYILAVILCVGGFAHFARAQNPADQDLRNALRDRWVGHWTSPEGYLYLANLKFDVGTDFSLDGSIRWTLVRSPRPADQSKLGMSGVEFVRGRFDPASRILAFEGVSKDDANGILGLDRYRLILAENNGAMGGVTYNHGNWQGAFNLKREERR